MRYSLLLVLLGFSLLLICKTKCSQADSTKRNALSATVKEETKNKNTTIRNNGVKDKAYAADTQPSFRKHRLPRIYPRPSL